MCIPFWREFQTAAAQLLGLLISSPVKRAGDQIPHDIGSGFMLAWTQRL